MKKFILALALYFVTNFSVVNAALFNDVGPENPYNIAINNLRFFDIIKGYDDGGFHPDQTINRAEFTKIVIGAVFSKAEIDQCTTPKTYSDVPSNEWFTPYVCLATANSIVQGYTDNTFKPKQTITFAEAAKIITKTFGIVVTNEDPWYKPFILALELKRAAPSSVTSIDLQITRGEMAEMIFRLREKIVDSENSTTSFFASSDVNKLPVLKESSCGVNSFKMAFILMTKPGSTGPSNAALKNLTKLASLFDEAFFKATNYHAKMETDTDITVMPITSDLFSSSGYSNAELDVFSIDEGLVLKNFYKNHADEYDFVTIVPDSFYMNPPLPPDYSPDEELNSESGRSGSIPAYKIVNPSAGTIRNTVKNIGKPIYDSEDIFKTYGSAKRLLSIINLLPPTEPTGLTDFQVYELLHEVGHQWCCGVDNSELAISDGAHFFNGLVGPYRGNLLTTGGITHFAINSLKKEFLIEDVSKNVTYKYHPFALYFMGLLPKDQYDDSYDVYKLTNNEKTFLTGEGIGQADFIRKVSINDIIDVMGHRSCELN